MNKYDFVVEDICKAIESDWIGFMKKNRFERIIIGISGGIDSTCCAALACKIFGRDNVYGVSLPCVNQRDIKDVDSVFSVCKIKRYDFNIGDAFNSIINGIENNGVNISQQTIINLPPRLRMATLYAFAQSIGAVVINTSNRSEADVNWDTIWGDDCGSYAPIQELTKTEIRELARYIGVPESLVQKVPIDGLQHKSDEDVFGFTYTELDTFIRTGVADEGKVKHMKKRFNSGKFKLDMIHIAGPKFNFPDYLRGNYE